MLFKVNTNKIVHNICIYLISLSNIILYLFSRKKLHPTPHNSIYMDMVDQKENHKTKIL